MKFPSATVRKQRGAVLVVSLIMLVVMTLFVISMLKTSVLELKIGGASQVAAINFANAELAITDFIIDNAGRFAPGFLGLPTGAGGVINTPPTVYGGTVAVTPTQLACGPWSPFNRMQMGTSSLAAVQFNVRSVATGQLGGRTTLVQGVESFAPPGAC